MPYSLQRFLHSGNQQDDDGDDRFRKNIDGVICHGIRNRRPSLPRDTSGPEPFEAGQGCDDPAGDHSDDISCDEPAFFISENAGDPHDTERYQIIKYELKRGDDIGFDDELKYSEDQSCYDAFPDTVQPGRKHDEKHTEKCDRTAERKGIDTDEICDNCKCHTY